MVILLILKRRTDFSTNRRSYVPSTSRFSPDTGGRRRNTTISDISISREDQPLDDREHFRLLQDAGKELVDETRKQSKNLERTKRGFPNFFV